MVVVSSKGGKMTKRFLDLQAGDGTRVVVNTSYITQVTPTHGTDFSDGLEVVFITFGDGSAAQISVPASKSGAALSAIKDSDGKFIDVKLVSGVRVYLNADYVTHVLPTHGTDYSDGATVSIFGTNVEVPASGVPAILTAIGLAG
jgi:hypothetical protein